MDTEKPITGELAALMPVLSQTMKYAVQALMQSSALADILREKGLVTKGELDEKMRSAGGPAKNLQDLLSQIGKTQ